MRKLEQLKGVSLRLPSCSGALRESQAAPARAMKSETAQVSHACESVGDTHHIIECMAGRIEAFALRQQHPAAAVSQLHGRTGEIDGSVRLIIGAPNVDAHHQGNLAVRLLRAGRSAESLAATGENTPSVMCVGKL